ncbi:uncharacterized protein LOC123524791 [Mercenaria mercenaria]|uniref:uncharacterized protein LOC123524791 n=1 Tax=Mercenaria mercenaria TaxID=6596 RepID=UPI00234E970E|nr:uncharacterized protein LOC123524791 [Mercenaria mercenaria]
MFVACWLRLEYYLQALNTCVRVDFSPDSQKPLKIIRNLHVATAEINVRVNADIILTCTVDQHSNNSVWRHNGKEIKPCDRLCVSVQELEHKLTIRNATLEDGGDYTVDYGDVKSSTTLTLKENLVFTKKLQDTFVYVGEPAIITCKLNDSDKAVIWQHDYKPVESTDSLKLVADEFTHWLVISKTKLTDAGYYSCVCGIESTKASLKVSERPLMITEKLHVTTAKADVRENMDIVLMCAVNLHTNEVIWNHDGTEITQGIRHLVEVQGLEHKLTIRNAKFEDDGDYTVAFGEKKSSTNLIIKGSLNLLHKKQLTEDLFKNWIRGALGIKCLKQGIQEFVENSVQSHHYEIKKQLPSVVCENCTEEVLLPSHIQGQCPKKSKCLCSKQQNNRRVCPNRGFCSKFYDKIFFDHRFFDLSLANTDIQSWGIDPWSVATCYISTTGYKGKPSAKDVDCSGLLSLLINNNFIHRSLGDVEINGETDLFRQARDARNEILHNANYELSEGQLQCYIDLFKAVLEIKDAKGGAPLSGQLGVQDAIAYLNEVVDRSCVGLKQVVSERSYGKQNQSLIIKRKIGDYNVQIKNRLINRDANDEGDCGISSIRMFPDGKVLLIDNHNGKMKKTDSSYKVVSHCGIPFLASWNDVCYIGNDRAVASYSDIIRYVNVSGKMKHEHDVKLEHRCYGLACHGDILYVRGDDAIYTYTIHCQGKHLLYKIKETYPFSSRMAISDDGERIYITNVTAELITIDNKGNHLFTLKTDIEHQILDVCVVRDGTVLVLDIEGSVHQVDYSGKQVLGTIVVDRSYDIDIKRRDDNDKDDCGIRSIRMLPDNNNGKLKTIDCSYNVVSHCDFPNGSYYSIDVCNIGDDRGVVCHCDIPILPCSWTWTDVCYIGVDRAVVCSADGRIQYVNVSGNTKLEHDVKLDHSCNCLACHGDILYVRGGDKIYIPYTVSGNKFFIT